MLPSQQVAVRVVDVAYNLNVGPKEWLESLLSSGGSSFNRGLGSVAVAVAGLTESGEPLISRVVASGDPSGELALRFARGSRSVHVDANDRSSSTAPDDARLLSPVNDVRTLSDFQVDAPKLVHAIRRNVGCKDVLALFALDSNQHGVVLLVPTRAPISLSDAARQRWRTLASHIGAADRLRRGLGLSNQERLIPLTALPRELKNRPPSDPPTPTSEGPSIRDAAAQVDQHTPRVRGRQDVRALDVWRGVVDGEWSMVDWFDLDGRRFVLARPNDPSFGDPRALTPQEQQVVLYTARGERRKLVGYRMGISRSRASSLLRSAMRKLGVRSEAELIMKVRCLEGQAHASGN